MDHRSIGKSWIRKGTDADTLSFTGQLQQSSWSCKHKNESSSSRHLTVIGECKETYVSA